MTASRTIAAAAIVASAACFGAAAQAAQPLERQPVLSLAAARAIADGCIAKAVERGWKMNVAVVDGGANPLLFERMDGAALGSIEHAQLKAVQSAEMGASTRSFAELAWGKDNRGGELPGLAMLPGFVTFAGGLPIRAGDALVGGVGVSGSLPDHDEACAQAGLDAAKDLLR
ncbi:GlcG/HbpS family heme-binding protein [Sinimarinibacterium flocculans]|uniref:GlcG/HbpS family heme-binding protein n=1 Tax=Sinimarinibacterium flocculans TaxID=985250 RepID=UPI002490660F|nr:heme-binding protein [Sinimarinibacterium flocculans]